MTQTTATKITLTVQHPGAAPGRTPPSPPPAEAPRHTPSLPPLPTPRGPLSPSPAPSPPGHSTPTTTTTPPTARQQPQAPPPPATTPPQHPLPARPLLAPPSAVAAEPRSSPEELSTGGGAGMQAPATVHAAVHPTPRPRSPADSPANPQAPLRQPHPNPSRKRACPNEDGPTGLARGPLSGLRTTKPRLQGQEPLGLQTRKRQRPPPRALHDLGYTPSNHDKRQRQSNAGSRT